ncbi:hypothetical protein RZS08_08750, partial [Arthrospira platensis SPKY1]|nr:hypothetical protein [Arthrospira platensis SPKY1]
GIFKFKNLGRENIFYDKKMSESQDVVRVRAMFPDMIEVDGEFGGIQRAVVAQVFTRNDDLIPGLEVTHCGCHSRNTVRSSSNKRWKKLD